MDWFLMALGCAAAFSFSDLLQKKTVNSGGDLLAVAWFRFALMALGVLCLQLVLPKPASVPSSFWLWVAAMTPLEILAFVLFVRSISLSPLSLTVPFLAFTPVFTLATGGLFLGEQITRLGIAGVVLVTAGAYLLNVSDVKHGGLLAPLKAVARERGSRLALVVAVIWSVTSAGGKAAIVLTSPLFFAAVYFSLAALVFFPVALAFSRLSPPVFLAWRPVYAWIGLTAFLGIFLHVFAISIAPVSYMIAVKRLSLVFAILLGHVFLKEERFAERLLGGIVMVAGVAVIVIGG